MTDPKWREMLITRVTLHLDEMTRELFVANMIAPGDGEYSGRVVREYVGRIVDDITEQLSEGSRPRADSWTVSSLREYLSETREGPANEVD